MKNIFEIILSYYLKRYNLIKILYRFVMKTLNISKTDINSFWAFTSETFVLKNIFLKAPGTWVNKDIWFNLICYQISIKKYNKHMQLISEIFFAHYNFSKGDGNWTTKIHSSDRYCSRKGFRTFPELNITASPVGSINATYIVRNDVDEAEYPGESIIEDRSFDITGRYYRPPNVPMDDSLSDRKLDDVIPHDVPVTYQIVEGGSKRGGKKLISSDGYTYTLRASI